MLYDKHSITLIALFTKLFISGSNQSATLFCTDFTCTVIFQTIKTLFIIKVVRFWLEHILLGKYFAKKHVGLEFKISIKPVILELKSSLKKVFQEVFTQVLVFCNIFRSSESVEKITII